MANTCMNCDLFPPGEHCTDCRWYPPKKLDITHVAFHSSSTFPRVSVTFRKGFTCETILNGLPSDAILWIAKTVSRHYNGRFYADLNEIAQAIENPPALIRKHNG